MQFIAQLKDADMPWNDTVPWVKQGPFRLYEKPGPSTANPSPEFRGTNPLYYAGFISCNIPDAIVLPCRQHHQPA